MELSQSNEDKSQQLAYRYFVDTCRSEATRETYITALHSFMDYLKLPLDAYDRLLHDKDPKLVQMDICDFITYLRKRGRASASVSTYVAALTKFYVMNDVTLNWKRIKSFMGEQEKVAEDRPYTHSEIQKLLDHSSIRNRAMILLMASAGLRVGTLPILRLKDLEPIDQYNIWKVNVYAKSKKSAYFSFWSPWGEFRDRYSLSYCGKVT